MRQKIKKPGIGLCADAGASASVCSTYQSLPTLKLYFIVATKLLGPLIENRLKKK